MRKTLLSIAAVTVLGFGSAQAAEAPTPPSRDWSFDGIFGTYDLAAAQRGLKVYSEVCAACHGLRLVAYRNLTDLGFSNDQVRAFAAEFQVEDGPNDEGEMFMRPGIPSDRFVSPYPNEQAARFANGGALPPDLSVLVKARPNGADYLYALLTGYHDEPPADWLAEYREEHGEPFDMMDGMYFNEYFGGHQIAMAPPLFPDHVVYDDGTEATIEQMSADLVQFLAWSAEPSLPERKQMGFKVMLFLLVFFGLLIAMKRRVWSSLH